MFRLLHLGTSLGMNALKSFANLDHKSPQDIMADMGGAVYQKASQATSLLQPESAVFNECVPWDEPKLQRSLARYCSAKRYPVDSFEFLASGSVGGVFLAKTALVSGERWLVKLQYDGIARQFEQDMQALRALNLLSSQSTKESIQQQEELFRCEFDYERERRVLAWAGGLWNTGRFAHYGIRVARVLHDQCLPGQAIAMVRLDGTVLNEYAATHMGAVHQPTQAMDDISAQIVRFLMGTWSEGVVFADPHWGNFIVAPSGCLQVLDFGSVRVLEESATGECNFRQYIELIRASTSAGAFVQHALHRHPDIFTKESAAALSRLMAEFHQLLWTGVVHFDRGIAERMREVLNETKVVGLPGTLACARMIIYMFMMFGYLRSRVHIRVLIEEFL